MTNADKFKEIFGLYATELLSKSYKEFSDWLNEDVPDTNDGDTISRKAAIDEIEGRIKANGYGNVALVSELNRLDGYIRRFPSAQSEHSQNTPQKQPDLETFGVKTGETCADAISRQEVIEIFTQLWDCVGEIADKDEWEDVCKTTANELPSARIENQVHLCDSCRHVYPECPGGKDDVIFGNGKGNDNICACNQYEPSAQPETHDKRTETHECDCISRQAAIDALERKQSHVERPITETRWFDLGLKKAQEVLSELPSAQRKGKWMYAKNKHNVPYCSLCNWEDYEYYEYNFCPNCGADMREGTKISDLVKCVSVKELTEWIDNWFVKNRNYHPYAKSNNIPITELYDILNQLSSAQTETHACD